MNNTWFEERKWSLAHGRSLTLGPKAIIMGIVNVTPDSFSDGGRFDGVEQAVAHAERLIEEGASILDVGGESTRPGAQKISRQQELDRILPVIEALKNRDDCVISIDTYHADTARIAVEAGAHIINDIWGLQHDTAMAHVAAETGAGLVLMNNRRERNVGEDLHADCIAFLTRSLELADEAGVNRNAIVLDPGFGFAETSDDDVPLLAGLQKLQSMAHPWLAGTSRKRFLGMLTGRDAVDRDGATAATSVIARMKGTALFRVHNVSTNRDALLVADAIIKDGISL